MKRTSARLSQYLFLALSWSSRRHRISRQRPALAAVNAFFAADPLVAVSYCSPPGAGSWLIFPGILLLLCSLLLAASSVAGSAPGDPAGSGHRPHPQTGAVRFLAGNFRFWLLGGLLAAALLGVNLVGLFDPLALLVRGLTLFLYPFSVMAVRQGGLASTGFWGWPGPAGPRYALLRDTCCRSGRPSTPWP